MSKKLTLEKMKILVDELKKKFAEYYNTLYVKKNPKEIKFEKNLFIETEEYSKLSQQFIEENKNNTVKLLQFAKLDFLADQYIRFKKSMPHPDLPQYSYDTSLAVKVTLAPDWTNFCVLEENIDAILQNKTLYKGRTLGTDEFKLSVTIDKLKVDITQFTGSTYYNAFDLIPNQYKKTGSSRFVY